MFSVGQTTPKIVPSRGGIATPI